MQTRGWDTLYHESGVFGPGGEQGLYDYTENGSWTYDYSAGCHWRVASGAVA